MPETTCHACVAIVEFEEAMPLADRGNLVDRDRLPLSDQVTADRDCHRHELQRSYAFTPGAASYHVGRTRISDGGQSRYHLRIKLWPMFLSSMMKSRFAAC